MPLGIDLITWNVNQLPANSGDLRKGVLRVLMVRRIGLRGPRTGQAPGQQGATRGRWWRFRGPPARRHGSRGLPVILARVRNGRQGSWTGPAIPRPLRGARDRAPGSDRDRCGCGRDGFGYARPHPQVTLPLQLVAPARTGPDQDPSLDGSPKGLRSSADRNDYVDTMQHRRCPLIDSDGRPRNCESRLPLTP